MEPQLFGNGTHGTTGVQTILINLMKTSQFIQMTGIILMRYLLMIIIKFIFHLELGVSFMLLNGVQMETFCTDGEIHKTMEEEDLRIKY